MLLKTLQNNFTYHKPSPADVELMQRIRKQAERLAKFINKAVPESREQSLAITKLEEASMWANAGIARYRNEDTDDTEN